MKKGEWYKTFDVAAGSYSSFTETDREKHAIKRRWMTPAFATASIKANEPLVIDIIERFCEHLKPKGQEWSEKWNAHQLSVYLGFDIMGALVFGSDFKSVQEEDNRALADCVLPAQKLLYWVSSLIALSHQDTKSMTSFPIYPLHSLYAHFSDHSFLKWSVEKQSGTTTG